MKITQVNGWDKLGAAVKVEKKFLISCSQYDVCNFKGED